MPSDPIFFLWVFVVLVIVVVIGILVYLSVTTLTHGDGPVILPNCDEDIGSLPDITSSPCCCMGPRGTCTPSINKIFESTPPFIVAPFPTPYTTVCSSLCPGGTNCTQFPSYNQCIQLLQPQDCTGAAEPLARVGTEIYWALEVAGSDCFSFLPSCPP